MGKEGVELPDVDYHCDVYICVDKHLSGPLAHQSYLPSAAGLVKLYKNDNNHNIDVD